MWKSKLLFAPRLTNKENNKCIFKLFFNFKTLIIWIAYKRLKNSEKKKIVQLQVERLKATFASKFQFSSRVGVRQVQACIDLQSGGAVERVEGVSVSQAVTSANIDKSLLCIHTNSALAWLRDILGAHLLLNLFSSDETTLSAQRRSAHVQVCQNKLEVWERQRLLQPVAAASVTF